MTKLLHMTQLHPNRKELQEAIKRRRGELGISQREVPLRGGPSRIVVARYELGEIPADVQPKTLSKLDRALEWEMGTAERLLKGSEPVASQEVTKEKSAEPAAKVEEPAAGVSVDVLRDYVSAVTRMQRALREETENLPDRVRGALDEVNTAQTDLILDMTDQFFGRKQ